MAHPLPPTPTTPAISSRPSKRAPVPLILSSFPAPPSHIPPAPASANSNPPPTGPPSVPLPPLPSGPSRISEQEQLLILSCARRSSKYSQRDSIINASPNRDSIASSRSPSSMGRPSIPISRSNSMTQSTTPPTPLQQLTRLTMSPIPLSDISDSDTEAAKTTPSPVSSSNSPRLLRRPRPHHPNGSVSSIDMRDALGVYGDDFERRQSPSRLRLQPRTRHTQPKSIGDPIDPELLLSRLELEDSVLMPPETQVQPPSAASPSISPSRPSQAAEAHQKSLASQSGSGEYPAQGGGSGKKGGGREDERQIIDLDHRGPMHHHHHSLSQHGLGGIVVTRTTSTSSSATTPTATITPINKSTLSEGQPNGRGKGSEEMTLDELGIPPAAVSKAVEHSKKQNFSDPVNTSTQPQPLTSTEFPRAPSPDIAAILSITPRPVLSLSKSRSSADVSVRSKSRSKSRAPAGQRRVVSGSTTTANTPLYHPPAINRQSESPTTTINGAPTTNIPVHGKSPSSELAYLHKHTNSNASIGMNGLPSSTANNSNFSSKKLSRSMSVVSSGDGSYHEQEVEDYDEALERVLEGKDSEDEDVAVVAGTGAFCDSAATNKRRGRRSGRVGGDTVQEEEIVGEGGGDSDSSLDLHTPLPHLMLRHGLLSPNSKLLPQAGCSRAATPSDERPGSIMSLISNGSAMTTKSGIIKDERDTPTRRVRHRDGKLLRGGIGLTTGLGWSDSEDEDAPSPLTRRLSSLNLSRRSSASSIRSANPALSASLSSSSLRRLHPLSRSCSSGAILETEREHFKTFESLDSYYDYEEEEEEEEEEDHTLEESGKWAQRHRLGVSSPNTSSTSPPVSWQHRRQPPSIRNRRNHQTPLGGTRTSTSSVGSTFSLEVTIPEGDTGQRRSGGGYDSSSNNNGNTPSTSSTLSIPMPSTPKDIFDPTSPPLLSSTRRMSLMNKDKSLPPLPAGGLKKKVSGNLQRSVISNGTSTNSTLSTSTAPTLNGTGKYAFPTTRARTISSASTSTPSPPLNNSSITIVGSPSIISSSSSAATIKPNVRPLQLPRQAISRTGDRPAVPVPSPCIPNSIPPNSAPATTFTSSFASTNTTTTNTNNNMKSIRAPTHSLSTHRPSPITPIMLGHVGTNSAPCSPAITNNGGGDNAVTRNATTTGIVRPKPRTGTGMVYRTSSYGVSGGGNSSKMRAPMMTLSVVSGGSGVGGGGGGSGGGGGGSIGRSNDVPRAIAL